MICAEIINSINVKLHEIISINDNNWNKLTLNEKCKIIHNCTGNLLKPTNNIIPLKSIKPKKLILFSGFHNKSNVYKEFWEKNLLYTRQFRNFANTKKYVSFNTLPKHEYNRILNEINYFMYEILSISKNEIDMRLLYNNIMGNNIDKMVNNNFNNLQIDYEENKLFLFFDEIEITMTLCYNKDIIRNDIPIKYIVNVKIL